MKPWPSTTQIDTSMRGKLMTRKRHIKSIYCMRCGKYQGNWKIRCECKPLWVCIMYHPLNTLCREQQCVYCVGATYPPKRYPKLFNIQRPATATATLALLRENNNRLFDKIKKIRKSWQ